VPLFAERLECPHCGRKVGKPKELSNFLCAHCGRPGPWASPEQVQAWGSMVAAREEYQARVERLIATTGSPDASQSRPLPELRDATALSPQELERLHVEAMSKLVSAAVADDTLTIEENKHLEAVLVALDLTWDAFGSANPALLEQAFVSSINGGMLPEVASPHILAKKGEVVHYECPANLMKEVGVRQYQGGYSGFSFPIGKTGIRYRVGATKGHSVQVGTQLQVADSGLLSITNKRVVYTGSRKTVDMPYSRLINLTAYSDGIQFLCRIA
jgi:hypothetical protein